MNCQESEFPPDTWGIMTDSGGRGETDSLAENRQNNIESFRQQLLSIEQNCSSETSIITLVQSALKKFAFFNWNATFLVKEFQGRDQTESFIKIEFIDAENNSDASLSHPRGSFAYTATIYPEKIKSGAVTWDRKVHLAADDGWIVLCSEELCSDMEIFCSELDAMARRWHVYSSPVQLLTRWLYSEYKAKAAYGSTLSTAQYSHQGASSQMSSISAKIHKYACPGHRTPVLEVYITVPCDFYFYGNLKCRWSFIGDPLMIGEDKPGVEKLKSYQLVTTIEPSSNLGHMRMEIERWKAFMRNRTGLFLHHELDCLIVDYSVGQEATGNSSPVAEALKRFSTMIRKCRFTTKKNGEMKVSLWEPTFASLPPVMEVVTVQPSSPRFPKKLLAGYTRFFETGSDRVGIESLNVVHDSVQSLLQSLSEAASALKSIRTIISNLLDARTSRKTVVDLPTETSVRISFGMPDNVMLSDIVIEIGLQKYKEQHCFGRISLLQQRSKLSRYSAMQGRVLQVPFTVACVANCRTLLKSFYEKLYLWPSSEKSSTMLGNTAQYRSGRASSVSKTEIEKQSEDLWDQRMPPVAQKSLIRKPRAPGDVKADDKMKLSAESRDDVKLNRISMNLAHGDVNAKLLCSQLPCQFRILASLIYEFQLTGTVLKGGKFIHLFLFKNFGNTRGCIIEMSPSLSDKIPFFEVQASTVAAEGVVAAVHVDFDHTRRRPMDAYLRIQNCSDSSVDDYCRTGINGEILIAWLYDVFASILDPSEKWCWFTSGQFRCQHETCKSQLTERKIENISPKKVTIIDTTSTASCSVDDTDGSFQIEESKFLCSTDASSHVEKSVCSESGAESLTAAMWNKPKVLKRTNTEMMAPFTSLDRTATGQKNPVLECSTAECGPSRKVLVREVPDLEIPTPLKAEEMIETHENVFHAEEELSINIKVEPPFDSIDDKSFVARHC